LHLIHELSEAGADLRQINAQIVEYWRALMLTKAGADAATILDLTEDEMREVKQLSQLFGLEELTECARVFAQNDLVQKSQGTPQLGLELASLECIELHRRAQSSQFAPSLQPRLAASQPAAQVEFPGRSEARLPQPSHAQKSPLSEHKEEKAQVQPSPVQSDGEKPALTVQQVNDAWEKVVKRTRQKTPSGTMAAMLRLYKIIDVEGTAEQPIVVIQSEKQAHYKYVKDEDRYKILEWALEMEFSLPCQVRLIPPGQPLPAAPRSDSAIYATSAAPPIAPQEPAHLERPVTPLPNPPEEIPGAGMQTPTSQVAQPGYEDTGAAALARMNIVRENTSVASHEDTIEQKVRRDPVVQEVMKTFSARIVEVHPK
jgi:DNA polymerase-3 subunit gamma/tau